MLKPLSPLRYILYLVVAAALMLNTSPQAAIAQGKKTLTVFAASSLTDAFKEVKTTFEHANPTAEIVYSFGSSSTLATQLAQGAPADIFASANAKQMGVAQDAKRIAGKPHTFAKNRLVLIVPADNPAKITSIKGLAKSGIKLVIAAPKVPVRDYTDTMIEKLLKVPGYGDSYKAAFAKNVVSEEENVRQVSAKVALGEADAGLVYRSDVTPDIASKVTAIAIPDAVNTIATYPIAVTDNSPNADLAQKYIDYVLSNEGQKTLVKWNFISSVIPALPAKIALPTDGALYIGGQVLNPLKLTADDLKNNYTAQKADVTYMSGDKSVTASFTGVYLRDLLDAAQVNFDADVKSDKVSLFIIGTGSDGYQAAIAYGELDPDFGNQPIMVAYEQDGKPIADKEGALRLVVPGDKRGGRYVSGLVSLEVRDVPGVSK